MKRVLQLTLLAVGILPAAAVGQSPGPTLVFQSDFGTRDGAVASMKGVAASVSPDIPVFDLTHQIPPFDIWRAAYRLHQSARYWPPGTVFVSVVDPGVGTDRKSVVLRTESGHYFVTPDNGTLTLVAEDLGIAGVREIDEAENRRRESAGSHTFHGRDVYAYTGARLAAGVIGFEEVGPALPPEVVRIPHQGPEIADESLRGTIPVLDVRFGNVWTNIGGDLFRSFGGELGESYRVTIRRDGTIVHEEVMPFARTFGEVPPGEALLYLNSLGNLALGLNRASFADAHGIGSGPEWRVELRASESDPRDERP